jgi:hypothetical protein
MGVIGSGMASLLCMMLLFSCCGHKQPNEKQKRIIAGFGPGRPLPLKIDSSFIAGLDTLEAMTIADLEEFNRDSADKNLAGDLKNSIRGCMLIEKLKQSGRYENYVDSLTIGMLKDAMAFRIGAIKTKDNFPILLWGINESSYDACPFYWGVSIIASYPLEKGGYAHILVGEDYSAGDPPSLMRKRTNSEIRDKEIVINSVAIVEDTDIPSKATENKYLKLKVEDGTFLLTQKSGK